MVNIFLFPFIEYQDVLAYQVLEILVERAKEIWPGQALFGRTKCNPIVLSGNWWGTNIEFRIPFS
jgi:hypothetical protein